MESRILGLNQYGVTISRSRQDGNIYLSWEEDLELSPTNAET